MLGQWELENLDKRHRHPDEARSKLERWVLKMGGTLAVSKAIGVHQITVVNWLGRRSIPNIESSLKLIEASKGKLTLQDILDGTKA